ARYQITGGSATSKAGAGPWHLTGLNGKRTSARKTRKCSAVNRRGRRQFRLVDEYEFVFDVAVDLPQAVAATGALDTMPSVALEQRAVAGAADEGAVFVEKAIVLPLQRHAEMRTAIQIY